MRVRRCFEATNDVERLARKHRTICDHGIHPFENLLQSDITTGHARYPGLGLKRFGEAAEIFKARVIVPGIGSKRDGPRYIYERLILDGIVYAIALHVYMYQEGVKEAEVVRVIKSRFTLFEPSMASVERLEKPREIRET